ncbi:hypothetical protein LZF95_09735 [Algoriphagus sp. AGSA1]|uniref:hypothetical protein n=1 Tax=Algoriphagus sp. AGSA1 TaxID=2907213 RepID=UPI001F27DB23|nr:hypothetical protein [Algoriphagus sp. AGSA1]MCE7054953.1 hypothetical protein [Algoriphagus sp. AGSA1]
MGKKSLVINYSRAAEYLDKVSDPELSTHFSQSLSGVFSADLVNEWRKDHTFSGLMFWFCFGQCGQMANDVLYLAMEPRFGFSYPKSDSSLARGLIPSSAKLYLPLNIQGARLDTRNGQVVLEQQQGSTAAQHTLENNSDVLRKMHCFLGKPEFWKFNAYGHGYFESKDEKNDYFEELLGNGNGNPTFFRYYFGFDPNELQNKIRMFLVPMNSDGTNRVVTPTMPSPQLLQKSWPPPPYS